MTRKGRFIMVDGIAGSGKSTVLRSVDAWATACGHKTFRLHDWNEIGPPHFEDVADYDTYFTYEPTRTWIGAAIRYELSRSRDPYDGVELAHAFALDRHIMYRRLIIPALEAGKTIIQDRGVSTSLVYQPIMPRSVELDIIKALPGNQLALRHAPDALILTELSAEVAQERIRTRNDESKGVFTDLEFLKRVEARFKEPWLHALFEAHGTKLFSLDTSGSLEQTNTRATELINQIIQNIRH